MPLASAHRLLSPRASGPCSGRYKLRRYFPMSTAIVILVPIDTFCAMCVPAAGSHKAEESQD